MRIEPELRNGRLVADIIVKTPAGKVRERANVPAEITGRAAAKRWGEARALHLSKHGKEAPVVEATTLAAFAVRWMAEYAVANGNKPATLDAKERIIRLHLVPVIGPMLLTEIGDAAAQKIKLHLRKAKPKTQACVLAQLNTMLASAERWKLLERAPSFPLPKVDSSDDLRFYDFEEWERLVAGAERAGPMVYAAILLAGEAGLRRGELVAIEQADCGPNEITARWNEWQKNANEKHVGSTKGGKVRRVPMTERLRIAIAKVRSLRGKRLLHQPSGRKVSLTTIQSWLETACRRAGLPESRDIHKLRHTFCSHLAMRGATAKAIQELAGHADIKTTMRYMHLSPAHKADAIKLLEHRVNGAGVERKSTET